MNRAAQLIIKDCYLDSNTQAIMLLNDNDSSVSIKPLIELLQNIKMLRLHCC